MKKVWDAPNTLEVLLPHAAGEMGKQTPLPAKGSLWDGVRWEQGSAWDQTRRGSAPTVSASRTLFAP